MEPPQPLHPPAGSWANQRTQHGTRAVVRITTGGGGGVVRGRGLGGRDNSSPSLQLCDVVLWLTFLQLCNKLPRNLVAPSDNPSSFLLV